MPSIVWYSVQPTRPPLCRIVNGPSREGSPSDAPDEDKGDFPIAAREDALPPVTPPLRSPEELRARLASSEAEEERGEGTAMPSGLCMRGEELNGEGAGDPDRGGERERPSFGLPSGDPAWREDDGEVIAA